MTHKINFCYQCGAKIDACVCVRHQTISINRKEAVPMDYSKKCIDAKEVFSQEAKEAGMSVTEYCQIKFRKYKQTFYQESLTKKGD